MDKRKIEYVNGVPHYYDMFGKEVKAGGYLFYTDGSGRGLNKREKVLLGEDGVLGTDSTSEAWIKAGRAVEGEFGIYPLEMADLNFFYDFPVLLGDIVIADDCECEVVDYGYDETGKLWIECELLDPAFKGVTREFTFDQVKDACIALDSHKVNGKIVVTMD